MKRLGLFIVLVGTGFALVASCSSFGDSSDCCGVAATGGSATGGTAAGGMSGGGGIGGTGCQRQEYAAPGCGADSHPVCTNGSGGACAGRSACGCDGHIWGGCGLYSAPYAYLLPANFSSDGGDTCDPTADAGR